MHCIKRNSASKRNSARLKVFCLSALVFLAACDGGSESSATKTPPADSAGTFSDPSPSTGPSAVPAIGGQEQHASSDSSAGTVPTLQTPVLQTVLQTAAPQTPTVHPPAVPAPTLQTAAGTPPVSLGESAPVPPSGQDPKSRAAELVGEGKPAEAARVLERAGLVDEAVKVLTDAGQVDAAAAVLTSAGRTEAAYDLYAPEDYALQDPTNYEGGNDASLASAVDEKPAVKKHTLDINGETVRFTAQEGHLTVHAPKDPAAPDKKDAQASIFYTAYTRDDQPKEKRPITFFFNGGPGSGSIWLHMGGWGPWRFDVNGPAVAAGAETQPPQDFPLVQNQETLLDQTDLVFVDPVGTGFSEAIAPHTNKDFWQVDVDASQLFRFVVRYINLHNRQSSPKYLYGESYGAGIRVPIMSRLMTEAGTSAFDADPSGRPTVGLTGTVFQSPVFDMGVNCTQHLAHHCGATVPTYAMTGEWYAKATMRAGMALSPYLDLVRKFTLDTYIPTVEKYAASTPDEWKAYQAGPEAAKFFADTPKFIGIAPARAAASSSTTGIFGSGGGRGGSSTSTIIGAKVNPDIVYRQFLTEISPGYTLDVYDARMGVKGKPPYNFDFYEHEGFNNGFKKFRPDYLNYSNASFYEHLNHRISSAWIFRSMTISRSTTTAVPDIVSALQADPSVKYLTVHGYYDFVTPFFGSERDLEKVGLTNSIPVKAYEGGHMTYYAHSARQALKTDLDAFYADPPHAAKTPGASLPLPAAPAAASPSFVSLN
ncbi:MAG: S10 family serine carboxypeptidase-like protein [Phyllobacterium sp.]